MFLDDLVDAIALDPFYPAFSKRKSVRSTFDGRVTNEGDDLKIGLDVPGVKKDDIDVTFESGNIIKIVAKRSDTGSTTTWRYTVSEVWDRESADAKLEDGVLSIILKKREREKAKKLLVR